VPAAASKAASAQLIIVHLRENVSKTRKSESALAISG